MTTMWKNVVVAAAVSVAACDRAPRVDDMPIGSEVQVTRQDGALVEGKLKARDDHDVKVAVGPETRTIPRESIAEARVVDPAKPLEPPAAAKFREYTVPAGTRLSLTLGKEINSATGKAEDPVEATLKEPVSVDGVEVLPAGARVHGIVSHVAAAGKVKGRASVSLRFTGISAHGDTIPVDARFALTAPDTTKKDAVKIGAPALGGAVIGAIAGGGKGAAIGAAVGGGAGTAAVLMTPGEEIVLPAGRTMSVDIDRPVGIRVPVRK
jgi:hypothetical protein